MMEGLANPDTLINAKLWNDFKGTVPGKDEMEAAYQKLTCNFFLYITSALELPLHVVEKKMIQEPEKVPDLSIVPSRDVTLSWKSLAIPVEVETYQKRKEGVDQVVSYNSIALQRSSQKFGFCIYTDCYTIEIIKATAETKFISTGLLPFLSSRTIEPTSGFQSLVKLLSSNLVNLGVQQLVTRVNINGLDVDLQECLGHGTSSAVYKATNISTDIQGNVVVKIEEEERSNLQNEIQNLISLAKDSSSFLPRVLLSTAKVMVSIPIGKSLMVELQEHGPNSNFDVGTVYKYGIHVFDILRYVHGKEICHHDVRPSNMILVRDGSNKKALLIDWGLVTPSGTPEGSLCGTIVYLSSCILKKNHRKKPWTYLPQDDLESLGWSIVYMILGNLPWHKLSKQGDLLAARASVVAQRLHSLPIGDFLEKLETLKKENLNYDNLRKILEKGLSGKATVD